MNVATFAGRLGRDAETKYTQSGTQVTSFSLAVDEYAGQGEKRTLWIDCTIWGDRGAKLAEYLAKGSNVTVTGQVGVRTYEAQGGTKAVLTLNVRDVTLQGGKQDGGQQQASRPAQQQGGGYGSQQQRPAQQDRQQGGGYGQRAPAPAPAPPMDDFADDDIPF